MYLHHSQQSNFIFTVPIFLEVTEKFSISQNVNREFDYNNNNIFLHLYSAFLGTQSNLHRRGGSPQPPPVCSIHLDDAMEAILHQNAHHTPAYWWRGDRLMQPISVWGLLGGHDGQRPMGIFGQDAGVTPLLFFLYKNIHLVQF